MAKAANKPAKGVPNRHLHSRIAYLHQAATYFALQNNIATAQESDAQTTEARSGTAQEPSIPPSSSGNGVGGLPLWMTSHLRAVSLKSQVRLSQDLKHSICKSCGSPLIAGSTSRTRMENHSRGGKKPWADVLVITCQKCDTERRFPVGATRQKKKSERARAKPKSKASDPGVESFSTSTRHQTDAEMEVK
ncbi:hypothetical protein M8818_003477 [Zalaria obscura]|uniref:Uncharacterized protein n=1 Tax=Zalaria obscura TaxID=2024903 RepID=A0ACC3SEZ0_9PEZI